MTKTTPRANVPGLLPSLLLFGFLLTPLISAAQSVRVPEGTDIKLEAISFFNPELYRPGSTYDFRVERDVVIDGKVVIARGTVVPALVRRLEDPDFIGEPGFVELTFKSVKAVDRQWIPLRNAIFKIEGKSRKKTSLLLSLLSDLFFFLKGEPAYIEPGTQIIIATEDTVMIKID
ncbi:MAG: hypothetical protein JW801_09165 [Bacteroidales bacterium]|nr:hypothetical protein [Bacteroidales bacterium]